jgi:hypothetical protein
MQISGRYQEAVKAYARANDVDKVVELKLRHLDEVQSAFDLVRAGGSSQGECQELRFRVRVKGEG